MTHQMTTLRISHTPDPDDAFAWWAIATGKIIVPGFDFELAPLHLQEANLGCRNNELDIAAISSAAYPFIANDYVPLTIGASVGRGYGPALATRDLNSPEQIHGRLVAVPGNNTTGALLFRLAFPNAKTIEMPCQQVAAAIANGTVDAGVLIHEELMNWQDKGLRRLACLGAEWHAHTDLPIPVGLIVVRRSIGTAAIARIATALRESIHLALARRDEALEWAMRYSIQTRPGIGKRFVEMFTNDDSLDFAPECYEALDRLYKTAFERGLIPAVPPLDFAAPADSASEVA